MLSNREMQFQKSEYFQGFPALDVHLLLIPTRLSSNNIGCFPAFSGLIFLARSAVSLNSMRCYFLSYQNRITSCLIFQPQFALFSGKCNADFYHRGKLYDPRRLRTKRVPDERVDRLAEGASTRMSRKIYKTRDMIHPQPTPCYNLALRMNLRISEIIKWKFRGVY